MCVLQEFVPVARELEKNWTRFSPHYIVWVCPWVYRQSDECKSQCIHNGRYCTPDPDGDLDNGYTGADVVQVSTNVTSVISCLVHCHTPFRGGFLGGIGPTYGYGIAHPLPVLQQNHTIRVTMCS